jgi:hypothetical protein
MKLHVILSIALAISSPVAIGALYTINSGTGSTASGIQDSLGRTFRSGTTAGDAFSIGGGTSAGPGVVAFGIFSTDQLSNLQTTNLVSAFTGFGNTAAFNTNGTTGNRSVYTSPQTAQVAGSAFNGKNVYLFAGNGTTFSNSTQFLVVKSNFLFSAAQDDIPTPQVWTIRPDNSQLLLGTSATNVQTANTDTSVTPGWQMATPVPEPSAAILGTLGALVLLRRRRN